MERNRVLITGLPSGENAISYSDLIIYFQSQKKSEGGVVSSLDILENGKALIKFEKEIGKLSVYKHIYIQTTKLRNIVEDLV